MNTAPSDVLDIMLTVCAVPLSVFVSDALWKLRTKLGMQTTAQDRANMEAEIQAAIGAGVSAVPQVLADGITTLKARQDIANAAAGYFRQRFPDRTKQISTAANNGTRLADIHAAVQQTIAARLTNVNPVTTLTATAGPGLGGVAVSAATTLPGVLSGAALPP